MWHFFHTWIPCLTVTHWNLAQSGAHSLPPKCGYWGRTGRMLGIQEFNQAEQTHTYSIWQRHICYFGSTNTRQKKFTGNHSELPIHLELEGLSSYNSNMLPGICHTDKTIYGGKTLHLWTSQWHHTVNKTWSSHDQYVTGCLLPVEMSNTCSHGTFWMGTTILQKGVQNRLSCQKSREEGRRRGPASLPSW